MSDRGLSSPTPRKEVDDGFGNVTGCAQSLQAVENCGLQVVRPGKTQCWCDGCEMPAEDIEALAVGSYVDIEDVAFIVRSAERRIRETRDE